MVAPPPPPNSDNTQYLSISTLALEFDQVREENTNTSGLHHIMEHR